MPTFLHFTCEHCGVRFQRVLKEARRRPCRFCSRTCYLAVAANHFAAMFVTALNSPSTAVRKLVRHKVRRALKSGRLVKKNCEHCSSDLRVEAHHVDYSQPLQVVWLCRFCHKKLHHGYRIAGLYLGGDVNASA